MAEALAFPINRGIDANGLAMAGAKAYFYDSETLNLRSVYADPDLTTPHTNPVVADSGGLFPNIYLDPDRSYRLILKNALGVEVADTDPVMDGEGAEAGSVIDFGAVGDGVTDDTAAIQDAIDAYPTGGKIILRAGDTYSISSVNITSADLIIDARGATIVSSTTASQQMITLTAARVKVIGGTFELTGGSANPWFFNVIGADCELDSVRMVKVPEAGGYFNYVHSTADGFVARNCRMEGSNGNYWEASNSAMLGGSVIGRSVGGDDGIAIKGINDSVRNVRIEGVHFENLASGLSIGSEVGTLAANDATYSRTVGQVLFVGNTLKNCYGIAFIKPGAIAGVDYRDGTAEGIVISNNTLIDETGSKFERGIAITPGRGGRVRQVYGRNNVIRARTANSGGRVVGGLDIFILNYAGGTTDASVQNINVEVDYRDIYNGIQGGTRKINYTSGGTTEIVARQTVTGATSGATGVVGKVVLSSGTWAGGDAAGYLLLTSQTGTFVAENLNVGVSSNLATVAGNSSAVATSDPEYAQGHPPAYIASVNREGAAGTASDIVLNVRGSGSAEAGLVVGTGLTAGAIRVENLVLTNVNQTNAAGQGGVHLLSDIDIKRGYWSVTPAAGTELAGTGNLLSQFVVKDSGLTASGSLEALPSIPSVHLDVDSGKGRVLAYQTGAGYLDLAFEAANILWRPAGALVGTVDTAGINLASGKVYKINAVQVVGARKTGWATATGTADRTTFDQATVTLPELAKRVKALIDDLHGTAGHGLIGT